MRGEVHYFLFFLFIIWSVDLCEKRKFSKVAVGDIGNYWYLFDTNVVF